MPLTLYIMENCPNCLQIKSKLLACGYEFDIQPMDTAESITEMRVNGCFAMEAPVLRVDDEFFEYHHCIKPGFFTDLMGMCSDHKEIPNIQETHK